MISDWMETVSYAARAFVTSGQADTTKHAVAKENKIFIHAKCSIYKPFFCLFNPLTRELPPLKGLLSVTVQSSGAISIIL